MKPARKKALSYAYRYKLIKQLKTPDIITNEVEVLLKHLREEDDDVLKELLKSVAKKELS